MYALSQNKRELQLAGKALPNVEVLSFVDPGVEDHQTRPSAHGCDKFVVLRLMGRESVEDAYARLNISVEERSSNSYDDVHLITDPLVDLGFTVEVLLPPRGVDERRGLGDKYTVCPRVPRDPL